MSHHQSPDLDVAIIGGGPAGGSLGAYLAKAGVECAVFERALFPRPHVGESLVPSSTRVFKDLDFLPVMEEARFPHKFGAVWTSATSAKSFDHNWDGLHADGMADIAFSERQQAGVDQLYTYHVDRGRFDNLLLHQANKFGAKVFEGVAITDVDVDAKPFPELRYMVGRKQSTVTARIIVDASGRRTFLGSRLKLKVNDPVFDQYAIHTWFDGYDRGAGGNPQKGDYIYVHFLPVTNTWVWQIPITDTITSVGVVTQKRHFKGAGKDRTQFFWECVDSRPELGQALRAAKQVRGFSEEGDYSYAMNQICGDNWLMVGDAGRFVDPIFSTGVSIALNSSRFATPDILKALETGDCRREAFSNFESTLRRGTRNWYNFITVYYRLNILFTAFINAPEYRLDVLKLLQGDVYEEQEPEVLTIMRQKVAAIENTPNHPWHKLLSDLTNDAFRPQF